MQVILLGAGASAGTTKGLLPVAGRFGAALAGRRPNWRAEYPGLVEVVDSCPGIDPNDWPLEEVWSRIDYFGKFRSYFKDQSDGGRWSADIHRAVTAIYGLGRQEIEGKVPTAQPACTLVSLLETLSDGDVLVSFNWDVLAENIAAALTPEGRCARLLQAPAPRTNGCAILSKPHGSCSWLHRFGHALMLHSDSYEPRLESLAEGDTQVGRQEPFYVSCVPLKSELIPEVQMLCGTPNVSATVAAQWEVLIAGLREADEVVMAGYRLPKEDHYARFLMQEAVRRRAVPINTVRVFNRPTNRGDLECQAHQVFHPVRVTFEGQFTPAAGFQNP